MDANVQNTIAIGITGLMTAAIMSILNGISDARKIKAAAEAKSKEKSEDYAREDEVARRVEVARIQAVTTAKAQNLKLDTIHILVNSEKTAGMERELLAVRTTILALEELADLKRANGKEPSEHTLAEIERSKAQRAELEAQLADRLKQTALADEAKKKAEQK